MKRTKKATLLIGLCLCLYSVCAQAADLERAVRMLEASGDFETAEPIAFKLTQEKKEHYYRIEFLSKYPDSEFAEIVYLQTWADVKGSRNIPKLRSFVKAAPQGPRSLEALERLFELYKEENTILGYRSYIEAFPNSPQAVEALEGIYRIAFQRATTQADKLKSVGFFDEYIRTFPMSPYVKEADKKAEEMEYRAIEDVLGSFSFKNVFSSKQRQKETIARKLYNEMRRWKHEGQLLISERKYRLLQKKLFIDTEAYTEMMDREETMDFRKEVMSFQKETARKLEDLNRLYKEESEKIMATIRQEADKTRKTIARQGKQTRDGLRYLASSISDLSYQKGRLAEAVQEQTRTMQIEARRASYEQKLMFDRAQEQSRRQALHSRHCAEVLSKHGKYTIFSGCP